MDRQRIEALNDALMNGVISHEDYLKELATYNVCQKSFDFRFELIGGVALGALFFGFGGLPAMIGMGCIAGNQIFKKVKQGNKKLADIEEGINIEEYLDEDHLRLYKQLQAQNTPSLPASSSALQLPGVTIQQQPITPGNESITSHSGYALPDLKLGFDPNKSSPMYPQINLALEFGRTLKPTIVTAKPRTGKGIVISHAYRFAKLHNPGLDVWVIDPKPHPKESGYYADADQYWGKMLEDYPKDDPILEAELTEFITKWRSQANRPTLLIIDEMVKIEAILPKWFKNVLIPLLKVESSSGETDQRFIWAITQSPLVTDIKLSTGTRCSFELLAFEKPETEDHLQVLVNSYKEVLAQPVRAYDYSPQNCLAYWSRHKKWYPVPTYNVPEPQERSRVAVLDKPIENPFGDLDLPLVEVEEEDTSVQNNAIKLKNWLETTGKQYYDRGEFVTLDVIKSKWRVKHKGQTKSFTADEILEIVQYLKNGQYIQFQDNAVKVLKNET